MLQSAAVCLSLISSAWGAHPRLASVFGRISAFEREQGETLGRFCTAGIPEGLLAERALAGRTGASLLRDSSPCSVRFDGGLRVSVRAGAPQAVDTLLSPRGWTCEGVIDGRPVRWVRLSGDTLRPSDTTVRLVYLKDREGALYPFALEQRQGEGPFARTAICLDLGSTAKRAGAISLD